MFVQETWERRSPDLPLKTPEQLVILASIVERETSKPEERTRVASVFINRLKQKKRLESDPTIIYGLIGGKGTLGHPITKSEKEQPTPYNTYMIDGLPPGPIGNPGRASIEAAANPARTKEMYFVADGAGGHVFSESYDQHLKNVARLRVIEHGAGGGCRAVSRRSRPADCEPPRRGAGTAAPARRQEVATAASAFRRQSCDICAPPLRSRPDSGITKLLRRGVSSVPARREGLPPMALSSMTGFARGHGVCGAYAWSWELKSVNAKGLDLRLRLPPGWDAVEVAGAPHAPPCSRAAPSTARLTVEREGVAPVVRVNEPVLAAVLATIERLASAARRRAAAARRNPVAQGRDRGHRRGRARRGPARRRGRL